MRVQKSNTTRKHDQPDRASSVLRRKNNTNTASDVVSNGLAHTSRT